MRGNDAAFGYILRRPNQASSDGGPSDNLHDPMLLLGLLAAVATFAVWGLCVLAVACGVFRGRHIAFRLAAAVGLLLWLAFWFFQILGLLGAFRLPIVVSLLLVAPLLVLLLCRTRTAAILRDAGADLSEELGELGVGLKKEPVVAAGVGLVALHLTVRFARVLATPTFGWDDFTYHLFRAGRWVQTGGVGLEPAPDAWTYYEFFPWGGDSLWAWALIWGAGDVLVPVVAIGVWFTILLAGYALVRGLGQEPVSGLIVVLAIATLPSQLTQLNTAYVDNAVLLMALVAGLCAAAIETGPGSGDDEDQTTERAGLYFLFGASCGLGMSIKMTFLPIAVVAGLLAAWRAWRSRRPALFGGFAVGTLVVAPNWAFNLFHRGSPLYPFRVLESLPYNQALEELLSAAPAKEYGVAVGGALKALLVNVREVDPFLNIGWLGLCLLILGVVGGFRRSKRVGSFFFMAWSMVCAVSIAAPALVGKGVLLLAQWLNVLGRFWVPGFAALFVLAAFSGKRLVRWLVLPLMLIELFAYAPRKWPSPIPVATLRIWVVGLLLLMAMWQLYRRWTSGRLGRVVGAVLMITLALTVSSASREMTRYESYRLFADWQLDDFHHNNYVRGWPVWRELDTKDPKKVAATAGFGGGIGHNWFRSPLLGSRLQNEVVYVPISTNGELVSYEDPRRAAELADRRAWLGRLVDHEVDYVAALGPRGIEHVWLEERPELFAVELESKGGSWILARVDRQAVGAYLDEGTKARMR